MNNNDAKNVELKFEYKSQLVTVKTNPFKTLGEIKKVAIKKFNIMNNNIINQEQVYCYYLGRNLLEYEHQKICELFSNREKITIKLVTPKKNLSMDINNNTAVYKNITKKALKISNTPNASPMKGRNFFTNFIKNTNIFSSGFNAIGRIKKDKNSVVYQLFTERLKNKNSLLPMINSRNLRETTAFSKKILRTEVDDNIFIPSNRDQYNLIDGIGVICSKCNESYINEYCRTCNEFICSDCKEINEHKNHLTIHLDKPDLNDSINFYGTLVQTDIEENINNNNDLLNKDKIINIIEQRIWIGKNEELIHKLETLIKMYQNILDILKNNYSKEPKNRMISLIQNFADGANKINEEINKLLNNINSKTKKKFDFNELKSYFDTINNNEVKVSELNRELIKYHLCSEINVKLNFIYNKLDKFINDAADIKKLFYLEPKYYNELIRLINIDKNKNSNNRNYQNYKANKFIDLNSSNDNSEADINRTSIDNEERKKSKK